MYRFVRRQKLVIHGFKRYAVLIRKLPGQTRYARRFLKTAAEAEAYGLRLEKRINAWQHR